MKDNLINDMQRQLHILIRAANKGEPGIGDTGWFSHTHTNMHLVYSIPDNDQQSIFV